MVRLNMSRRARTSERRVVADTVSGLSAWRVIGTKMPGGMLTPVCALLCAKSSPRRDERLLIRYLPPFIQVSMNKKEKLYEDRYEAPPESVCVIM